MFEYKIIKGSAYVLQTTLYCGYPRGEYDRNNKFISTYAITISTYRQASFHYSNMRWSIRFPGCNRSTILYPKLLNPT